MILKINKGALFFVLIFALAISGFCCSVMDNVIFFHQRQAILKKNDIRLEEKMLNIYTRLYLDDYINENRYISVSNSLASIIEAKKKNIIRCCEQAVNLEEKFFILERLQKNLNVEITIFNLKKVILTILSGAQDLKKMFNFVSDGDDDDDEHGEEIQDSDLSQSLYNFCFNMRDKTLLSFWNGFIYSILRFTNFNWSFFVEMDARSFLR